MVCGLGYFDVGIQELMFEEPWSLGLWNGELLI